MILVPILFTMLILHGSTLHGSTFLRQDVIAILFLEQLIKVMFATETMGLNMPARTVVATRKWDGGDAVHVGC